MSVCQLNGIGTPIVHGIVSKFLKNFKETNIMTLVNFAPKPVTRSRNTRPVQRTFYRNTPLVNISELDDSFEIQIAIPGITKDQIKLDIKDDQLFVTAEENSNSETKFLRKEYDFSTFKKVFNLNEEINQEAVEASLVDGVLTIRLNKKEEAKAIPPRTIAIK